MFPALVKHLVSQAFAKPSTCPPRSVQKQQPHKQRATCCAMPKARRSHNTRDCTAVTSLYVPMMQYWGRVTRCENKRSGWFT